MAEAFNKFETFVGDLGLKVHDLNADLLECYLTNNLPDTALDSVIADLAEIATGFGYAGPQDTQNGYTETTGTGTCTGINILITAAGGTIGPFQYVVLMNTTPTSPLDPLIGWWTRAAGALTLQDGESFTIDFTGNILFTLA